MPSAANAAWRSVLAHRAVREQRPRERRRAGRRRRRRLPRLEALPPLAAEAPEPGRDQRVVGARDEVDRRAHQRRLDDLTRLERLRQRRPPERAEARPQPDVAGRRVLVLDPADRLERGRDREVVALEEALPGEERAVQVGGRQDALGHDPILATDSQPRPPRARPRRPVFFRRPTNARPATLPPESGGAHEGRRRQGDRARRAARRPGTRSARQAARRPGSRSSSRPAPAPAPLIPDSAYADAGATIVSTVDLYAQSDVDPPRPEAVGRRGQGACARARRSSASSSR